MMYELIVDEATQADNQDFKYQFKTKIENLSEQAPSDSNICTKISKLKRGYIGVLEVFSSEGHFTAKAFDLNPKDLGLSLLKEIYRQITNWKKHRIIQTA